MPDNHTLEEPITIEIQGYRKRTFKTVEQVLRFATKEHKIWSELQEKTNPILPFNSGNPIDRSVNVLSAVINYAQSYINNPDPNHQANSLSVVNSHLEAYATEEQCVSTDSPDGKVILGLAEDYPIAACVLLASVSGIKIPQGNVIDALSFGEAVYHSERAWEKPENLSTAHKKILQDMRSEWEELSNKAGQDIKDEVKISQQSTEAIEKQAKQFDRHHNRLFSFFRNQYDGASSNLTGLETTYHKKLQLEAPATYWRNRKRSHLITSAIASIIFLTGVFIALSYVLEHGPSMLKTLPKDDSGNIGLGAIAVLTIPAAAVAWALRIFTRLFGHNLNMAADAAQRQTMITTYLALANDPKANLGPDERVLILNALFRPSENHGSADAPPPNLMELAKAVSGKGRE